VSLDPLPAYNIRSTGIWCFSYCCKYFCPLYPRQWKCRWDI